MTDDIESLKAGIKRLDAKLSETIDFLNRDVAHSAEITQGIHDRMGKMVELIAAMSEKVFPGYLANMTRMKDAPYKSLNPLKKPPEK
jgi:hypothetical protein